LHAAPEGFKKKTMGERTQNTQEKGPSRSTEVRDPTDPVRANSIKTTPRKLKQNKEGEDKKRTHGGEAIKRYFSINAS